MSPQRILHILQDADRGHTAQARILESLARWLDPQRYQQYVWFLGAGGPLVARLEKAGLPVRVVPWQGFRTEPLGAWRFLQAFRAGRFALVHQHLGGRSLRWLVQKTSRARVVLHLHARYVGTGKGRRLLLDGRNSDAAVAVCRAVAEQVVGAAPEVIYPGVDLTPPTEAARPGTGRVIGAACRLVPAKGLHHLLQGVATLRAEFPDVRVEIAGAGPEQETLKQQAQQLGIGPSVEFLGWQDNLAQTMERWDVLAHPSLEEGFPLSVLDAMAAGLPVVAADVGGTKELVEHGKTGWLVPPADVKALAERLRGLLLNPEQCRQMGAAGRACVGERFSAQQMAAAVGAIYEGVLSADRR